MNISKRDSPIRSYAAGSLITALALLGPAVRCLPVNLRCRIDVDRSIYCGGCGAAWRSSPGRGLARSFGLAPLSGLLIAGPFPSIA
jgi:hypothetical protein